MLEDKKSFLVTYNEKLYDIGPFLSKHPGGRAHLEPYRGRSVTTLMNKGHAGDLPKSDTGSMDLVHSEAAKYILKEYHLPTEKAKNNVTNGITANGYSNGHLKTDTVEIEDMEYLVNWEKPMLSQVAFLGGNYEKWVNLPVDRKLRLFGPDWLEALTKSRWFMVPIVWLPVAYWYLSTHFQGGSGMNSAIIGVILGIINWTLLEYTLHKYVFHLKPGSSPALITTHFLIHGLHHKVPYDSLRLVFPPVPAAILCVILHNFYNLFVPKFILFSMAAGTVIGYIFYDLTHYYLHFGAPRPSTHMYNMKRYHNRHHFSHHDLGYGITSPIWDHVFGTKIFLQKLAKGIKW